MDPAKLNSLAQRVLMFGDGYQSIWEAISKVQPVPPHMGIRPHRACGRHVHRKQTHVCVAAASTVWPQLHDNVTHFLWELLDVRGPLRLPRS